MKPRNAFFCAAALGWALSGCSVNPLGLGSSAQMPGNSYGGIKEINDGEVIFAPQMKFPPSPIVKFPSGGIATNVPPPGNVSVIYGLPYFGPIDCGGNCSNDPDKRGVGGPAGDFNNDYFYRYAGIKGPDPSKHYSNVKFNFTPNGATGVDLRQYRGFVFWARGHGNFAVNLVARLPKDSINPPATGPYSDYNFYLRRFGAELNGDTQWKEIVVYFSDMVQEFGLAVDLNTILVQTTGLQFDQQLPYTTNFKLDLDYIRLFK